MTGMDSRETRGAGAQPQTVPDFIAAVVISEETQNKLGELAKKLMTTDETIVAQFIAHRGLLDYLQSRNKAGGGIVIPVSDDKVLQDIESGVKQGSIGPRR